MNGTQFIGLALLFVATIAVNVSSTKPNEAPYSALRSDIKGRLLTPEEGCGYSKVSNTRIVGGTEAKIGAWPWFALLGYKTRFPNRPMFKCGGSLTTTRHVLSAAHCIEPELYVVRLGEHDLLDDDGEHIDAAIEHAEEHEQYDEDTDVNDIAMIYLVNDVQFTDRIRPICLLISGPMLTYNYKNSNPFACGFGKTEEDGLDTPVLLEVQLPILETEDCKKRYKKIGQFKSNAQFDKHVICAGYMNGGKDTCQGDSGGPLMLPIINNSTGHFPFYLIGVVSRGWGCGTDAPGIYMNVQQYADWILTKLQQ